MPDHPELDVLPEWPIGTIAVLATVDHGLAERDLPFTERGCARIANARSLIGTG